MVASARIRGVSGQRSWLVMLVVAALVLSIGLVAGRVWLDVSAGADCEDTIAGTAVEASARALSCDMPVENLAERTPWMTVQVLPDGSSRMTIDAVPTRAQVNGDWVPVDPAVLPSTPPALTSTSTPVAVGAGGAGGGGFSMARGAELEGEPSDVPPGVDGMLPVAAPVFPMWFNPGGEAGAGLPLGVVQRDGAWVKMWFPLDLPAPDIDGRFVTYELTDDVRVRVAVGVDTAGFRPIVEIDTSDAAAWFATALDNARLDGGLPGAGLQIPYRLESSEGLALRAVDGVGFELVDAEDEVLFWSPPSLMWDSSAGTGEEAGERAEFPLPGDRALSMQVDVVTAADQGDVVLVTPDAEMLSSADTVWPVRVLRPGFIGGSR